jgi:hypothetical protein
MTRSGTDGPTPLDDEEHELARTLLAESREELTRADSKASLLLAAFSIGISAILGAILADDWTPLSLEAPWEGIFWVGVSAATAGLLLLSAAVWPKVTHQSGKAGVTYFGEAARFETPTELEAALRRTSTDPIARTVTQLHVIARRADAKYAFIRSALVALWAAATLVLVAAAGGCVGF